MDTKDYGVFGDGLAAAAIGSWKIEVDEGRPPRMYADATMKRLLGIGGEAGLTPEEVYHAWYDNVDPAHYDAVAEGVKYMMDGQLAEIQYPWHHPDGRTIVVRCGGVRDDTYVPSPVPPASAPKGIRVAGIHQWVTYMKHVDRKLEEQTRLIEKQRHQLEDSLAFANYFLESFVATYIVNLETHAIRVNSLSAGPKPELPEKADYLAALREYIARDVHPEDRGMMEKFIAPDHLSKHLRENKLASFRFRDIAGEGERTYRLSVVRGGDEHTAAFAFADVTEEALKEKRLQDALAMERANQAKSYFFSMVSHDIRTPLNAIIGYAELLKLGMADAAERAAAIDSVLVSGHTLLELINDVLDLSKLEAGKMEILPEPIDAARLVEEVAKAFRASIGSKPVEIRTDVSPMPWLKLDPHRVRQILFNLAGNAVKFTEKGYVEIKASYGEGMFRFSVADTGCGISEEDQQRIAQPYVQVGSSTGRSKGTGLGLAICGQLVGKMDGTIELQSALGVGTRFSVEIPCEEDDDRARRARLSTTQRIRIAVESKAKTYRRILVVDDQPMNRMVLKNMLSRFGIREIVLAENGRDALAKLAASAAPFDLVLADMWMPELDGEGLVRAIRRNAAWAKLPVVAVTADVEANKDYAEMGFTDILLKPITLEKLKGLLN